MFDYEESLYDYKVMIYKQELKKIKKQIKGYKFSKAELEKKNKQGMKLKDILSQIWMGDKIK